MSRCVAVDVEFIKCRGAHFARAVALVPFSAQPLCTSSSTTTTTTTTTQAHGGVSRRTCLHAPPTVLFLRSRVVMTHAEVLPCGHVLRDHVARTLVRGDELARIKARHTRDAASALDLYAELRREAKTLQQQQQQKASSSLRDGSGSSNSVSGTRAWCSGGLSLGEATLRRELQIRAAIASHYDVLDAHSMPNIRHGGNTTTATTTTTTETALRQLYDADVDSSAFAQAVQQLSSLRSYGKGRGAQKSFAFLARYQPRLLHDVLHASFASASQWCAWLHTCADMVEADLHHAANVYTTGQYPLVVTTTTTTDDNNKNNSNNDNSDKSASLRVYECDTLEELSRQLSYCWHRCLYTPSPMTTTTAAAAAELAVHTADKPSNCKMFVYGSADRSVLHATLRLSCDAATTTTTMSTSANDDTMLRSPYQAHVVDVTSHSLFAAAGFTSIPRRVPSLAAALDKAAAASSSSSSSAAVDATAQRVRALARVHDVLWDAQALACVCVACGLARSDA